MTAQVSVSLISWNNQSSIAASLDSALKLRPKQICLHDLGSNDGTVETALRICPDLRVFESGIPVPSLAEARNLGLYASNCDYLLFMDADWTLNRSNFRRLLAELSSRPDVGLAVPRFLNGTADSRVDHNICPFPTVAALCRESLSPQQFFGNDPWTRNYQLGDFDHKTDRFVDTASGAVVLARREALLEARGYDERYRPAVIEDVDLGQRLRQAGYRTLFCSAAAARHLGQLSMRHSLVERHYSHYYRGVLTYCRKYLGVSRYAVGLCLLVGLATRTSFTLLLPAILRSRILGD